VSRTRRSFERADGGLPRGFTDTDSDVVWLFTCVACGHRWTDPPAPVVRCGCGGNVVAHRFREAEYRQLLDDGRLNDQPASVDA
jgi:hypothetical protein